MEAGNCSICNLRIDLAQDTDGVCLLCRRQMVLMPTTETAARLFAPSVEALEARNKAALGDAKDFGFYGHIGGEAGLASTSQATGVKHDLGKPRIELISAIWVEGVADVLTFGAKKYASHNWRKGLEISRCLGAAFRHMFAVLRGEDLDKETGLHHLLHASCELMFAYELLVTRPELDDRWKPQSTTKPEAK